MSARLMGAYVETAFLKGKYNDEMKKVKEMDKLMTLTMKPMVGPYLDHPSFETRARGFVKDILAYEGPKDNLSINFGDSIVDMWHDRWQSINLPFSVGGFHHFHMLKMAMTLKPVLDAKKLNPKYIMIGTLGGNPLLQWQEINSVIAKSIECLDGLRIMWPQAKLIVYGLPPVVTMYATAHSLEFEAAIYKWVVKDSNSVFLPMFKGFAGKWGLMPKSWVTAEGVHLSPVGQVLLDDNFETAKKAVPKSIVD